MTFSDLASDVVDMEIQPALASAAPEATAITYFGRSRASAPEVSLCQSTVLSAEISRAAGGVPGADNFPVKVTGVHAETRYALAQGMDPTRHSWDWRDIARQNEACSKVNDVKPFFSAHSPDEAVKGILLYRALQAGLKRSPPMQMECEGAADLCSHAAEMMLALNSAYFAHVETGSCKPTTPEGGKPNAVVPCAVIEMCAARSCPFVQWPIEVGIEGEERGFRNYELRRARISFTRFDMSKLLGAH